MLFSYSEAYCVFTTVPSVVHSKSHDVWDDCVYVAASPPCLQMFFGKLPALIDSLISSGTAHLASVPEGLWALAFKNQS